MSDDKLPEKLNQAFADSSETTMQAAQLLDCRIVFDDGLCDVSCLNCGLKRTLLELYLPEERQDKK